MEIIENFERKGSCKVSMKLKESFYGGRWGYGYFLVYYILISFKWCFIEEIWLYFVKFILNVVINVYIFMSVVYGCFF